ncbi:MAG: MaoC family dehydratase [SAR202 cluster bacterium]|nr:MaoC family dehydratase [SAR202 cluster bacterium]
MKKNLYFEDVEIGDDIGPIKRSVTDEDVIEFVSVRETEITPSRFTSNEVANSEGMPEAIVPGPMNIALMSQILTDWSDTVCLLKIDVVFRQTVPHNNDLTFSGIVTDKDETGDSTKLECDVVMENSDGVKLVIGTGVIALPNKP